MNSPRCHFNAISTPFQRHFNASLTPFQPQFNPISTPFNPILTLMPTQALVRIFESQGNTLALVKSSITREVTCVL